MAVVAMRPAQRYSHRKVPGPQIMTIAREEL